MLNVENYNLKMAKTDRFDVSFSKQWNLRERNRKKDLKENSEKEKKMKKFILYDKVMDQNHILALDEILRYLFFR